MDLTLILIVIVAIIIGGVMGQRFLKKKNNR
jgi:uncharacterized protein YneF (UPF0154 family)